MRVGEIFSRDELRDIFIAIVVLTVIFSYPNYPSVSGFLALLPSAFIVVVTSFLIHELAHKFAAIRYGAKAYFKIWPLGLLAGIVFMFIPMVKIVAPGSVVVYSHKFGQWKRKYERYSKITEITIKEVGVIAAVGPLMNIVIALIAWGMLQTAFVGNAFLSYLVLINSWLAIINLIPMNPLDGAKVFTWKPWLWLLLIVVSAIFLLNIVPYFMR
jgi:Zn-dependent protease